MAEGKEIFPMQPSRHRLDSSRRRFLNPPFIGTVFIVLALFAAIPFVPAARIFNSLSVKARQKQNDFHPPRQNVWADLNPSEAEELLQYLLLKPELNLTEASKAQADDNFVTQLEVLQPNKTDVLHYLEGTAGKPQRWARVSIAEQVLEDTKVASYMVGPLPPSNSTTVLPLTYIFNRGNNTKVVNPVPRLADFQGWAIEICRNVSDITRALLDNEVTVGDPNGLDVWPRMESLENGTLKLWVQFYRQDRHSDGKWLLPQGLYFRLTLPTNDLSQWRLGEWYYNGILYASVDELRRAIKSPDFQKSPFSVGGSWTDTEDFDHRPVVRDSPPPVMIQPRGPRYQLDNQQKFISWMGFEFYLSTSWDRGVALHDVKLDGDSIIYELSLQEALAHYAGNDPQQGGLEFLDSMAGMGVNMYELVPGYDCPPYATYLSTNYHDGEKSIVLKNSICVFEYTADFALQRHTADSHVSISKNTYLVVRSVATMANYDFTFDYLFYLDGTIEVKLHASGFIFGAFRPPKDGSHDEYGYRVYDATGTSMHDHVLNFRADLDVAGTSNRFMRVGIEPLQRNYPWDNAEIGPRHTMHLVPRLLEKEDGIDWPHNSEEMFIVLNQDENNAWNEKRGYRIVPGTGVSNPAHLTIVNSTALGKSAEWAQRDLWVLKRKDTEPRSSDPLNVFEPEDPLIDFGKFLDDENVVDEDLVVYFNLGMHHVPHSGDIPNTLMHTSASSIMFTPFNFHDRDPSRQRAQGVRVDFGTEGANPRYYGAVYNHDEQVKKTSLEPDLTHYRRETEVKGRWLPKLVGRW